MIKIGIVDKKRPTSNIMPTAEKTFVLWLRFSIVVQCKVNLVSVDQKIVQARVETLNAPM